MRSQPIHTHVFVFNNEDNGGEQLVLTTKFIPNGDPGVTFRNQTLTLNSYCNSASFELAGATIDSATLLRLADSLEEAEKEAQKRCLDMKKE